MLPNFFLVGAPKAGTTSLFRYLGQHPDVFTSPIKEPLFFATDLFEWRRLEHVPGPDPGQLAAYLDGPMDRPSAAVVSEWDQYLKLFRNVRAQAAVGEASGNYLASREAPREISARIPQARIIMMLRDPAQRLFSQYSQASARGQAISGFLPWVEEQQAREAGSELMFGAVRNGFYARHLRRYLDYFPLQQVRPYLYEDYTAAPAAVLRDIFSFLGVSPEAAVDVSRHDNVTAFQRPVLGSKSLAQLAEFARAALPAAMIRKWRVSAQRRSPQMTRAERAAVIKIYADDIRELQGLLKRDLSSWLLE